MDNVLVSKQCTRCKKYLPATLEHFKGNPHGKFKLHPKCKICMAEINKQYKEAHKETIREYHKRWSEANADKLRANDKRYYRNNRKRLLEQKRKYAATHVYRKRQHLRKARQANLPATFTDKQWEDALSYFGYRCAVCERPRGLWHTLSQDHWIPLTKGGGYTSDNIVPLCHGVDGCNNKKTNKDAYDWLLDEYSAKEARRILSRIEAYFAWVKGRQ